MRGESLSGPPPRRPGIRDVAREAGVAISTVSKVLSGRGEVSPPLRARVLAAAAELGYQPNYLAQSLRSGATNLIGLVSADLRTQFSAVLAAGIEGNLRSVGYALLVISSADDPAADAANIRYLHSRRVDAIILAPSREDDPATLTALAEFDGPVVAVESELRGLLPVDAVSADHRAGAASATEHLLALGHRRIAALTGPLGRRSGRERLTGMLATMSAAGHEDTAIPVPTSHDADAGEEATLELLDRPRRPTALLAGSPLLLEGALRALDSRSVEVGSEVSLVGWDDGPLPQLFKPPIAVVDRDVFGLGQAAADLVLSRLGDAGRRYDGPARVEVRPTTFIPRASCAAPAAAGAEPDALHSAVVSNTTKQAPRSSSRR
jgi:LacI family transcriptional regulator